MDGVNQVLAKTIVPVPVFDTYRGEKIGKTIPANTTFGYLTKRDTWLQLTTGYWVSCGTNYQYIQLVNTAPPPPPPAPVVTAKHTILVDELGRLSVDGLPYE